MIVFSRVVIELSPGAPPALDDVSLTVPRGKLLALIGPSGGGKSTLMKAAAGLVPISSGEIHVDGVPVQGRTDDELWPVRSRMGMLFQQGGLFDTLSVLENVSFPLARKGVCQDIARRRALLELERVGLSDAAHLLPAQLSGGMRKRVGIARALVTDPPVALFDEPTAGLDPVTGARILDLLRAACDEREVTAIAAGHEVGIMLRACDSAAVLIAGRLAYAGPADTTLAADDPNVRLYVAGIEEQVS